MPGTDPSPGAALGARISAHLLATLVLAQALLAGQFLFRGWSINIHEMVGNFTFLVALAAAVFTAWARYGAATRTAAVLVVLITAQTGLGYLGRTHPEAASWHVPLGVAIFGLTVYHIMLLPRPEREPAAPSQ